MSYIFIEFELEDRHSIKTKNYCLGEYTPDLLEYISQTPKIKHKGFFTIQICRVLQISDLKPYQQIFNFTDQQFCSVKEYNIFGIIKSKFLEKLIKAKVDQIFDKYTQIDSSFEIYRQYYLNTQNWFPGRSEFYDFLAEWNQYLDYQLHIKNFRVDDSWDPNINNLVDQYANPMPYI